MVATSSLELGIDMGAVDLVVQIETPPSVASGLQRIGRAGHQVEGVSRGVIFPKYRGDLLSTAAITRAMDEGRVEETRVPRNPLDVLTQQIVAMCAVGEWRVDDLERLVRQAAPFATLTRGQLEGVLDMLSGRYPADELAELRPRITWDRLKGTVRAREGLQRLVVANAGTIPDRGLYGVFLADGAAEPSQGQAPSPDASPPPLAGEGSQRCGAGAAAPAAASASLTRRWSSRAARATSSSSAPPPGASSRSPATASSSSRPPASPAGCRSGAATGPAAPSSWARRSAGSPASSSPCRSRRRARP